MRCIAWGKKLFLCLVVLVLRALKRRPDGNSSKSECADVRSRVILPALLLTLTVTRHTVKYGDPYSEFMLCIYPSKVHTHISEHTHRQQWAAIYCCGFGALLKGTSVMALRVERALYIHSPHRQFLLARDSNSQPFDHEPDSLAIRPRLPLGKYSS